MHHIGEDVRAVANELLVLANGRPALTNLSLQKLTYFLHGQYLLSTGTPLVSGYYEAWEYGPVHPLLYSALNHLGNRPLATPIQRRSMESGILENIPRIADQNVRTFIQEASVGLFKLSAGQLVELSHAPNTPWDEATRWGNRRTWGLRLDNELIRARFRFHKRSVSDSLGEYVDERPPSGD